MNDKADEIQDKLALLRQSYLSQLPKKIDEINEAAKLPVDEGEASLRRYLETLEGLAHKLAGSGATFGFPEISFAAREFEHSCEEALNLDELSVSSVDQKTTLLLDALRNAIENAVDEQVTEGSLLDGEVEGQKKSGKVLLIISDDEQDALRLGDEISQTDFSVHHVNYAADFELAIKEISPAAIILEAQLDRDDESGLPKIEQLRERAFFDGPLIVISDSGDIRVRLQAVRASAEAFLLKPITSIDLIDLLDQHLQTEGDNNFRILIVDDDISTAKYTEVILQGAGMIAEIAVDPMTVLEKLEEFGPELILMDLYMPQCSGQELAVVVRQQESFATIPIVFLSGEANIDKQLIAMRSGGDDFLTKPIKPQHLISSVRTRVRRFRLLRSRMVRDSMTGLLNHTATHEFLENEIARAERNKTPLCVAAIDIDHFKSVNDTHGHAVGDQVIKSLSRLLKQRLRKNDVIGRMGGEEFAAVLGETPINEAKLIFNGIRQAFSDIEHPSGKSKFSVTISCGIAEYPRHQKPMALLEHADKALYEAKHAGRNRVVVDSDE